MAFSPVVATHQLQQATEPTQIVKWRYQADYQIGGNAQVWSRTTLSAFRHMTWLSQ
jgi:hypothetical protein